MIKQVYNLPDNFKLTGTAELPKVKVDEHAIDEGM